MAFDAADREDVTLLFKLTNYGVDDRAVRDEGKNN